MASLTTRHVPGALTYQFAWRWQRHYLPEEARPGFDNGSSIVLRRAHGRSDGLKQRLSPKDRQESTARCQKHSLSEFLHSSDMKPHGLAHDETLAY